MIENASVEGFTIADEDLETLDGLDEDLVTDWYVVYLFTALSCASLELSSHRMSTVTFRDYCSLTNLLDRDPTDAP